jgi:phosphoesterase RecJ-like protein
MKIIPEFATGYIYLNKDELKEFCFQKGDTEGFVNYPLSIKGIRFAALFLERDGYIKISFRSVGAIPVNEIMAKHFSGGGHKNAAGGEEINLSLDECIKKFKQFYLYKDRCCMKRLYCCNAHGVFVSCLPREPQARPRTKRCLA